MNVPIQLRSHELDQVHEFTTEAINQLKQAELDDAESQLERIYDEHISGVEWSDTDDVYLSMPAEDWRQWMRYLNRVRRDDQRVWWLQNKLVGRLNERMEELNE